MSVPEFRSKKHENFRTINVNGMFGGVRLGYIEATIYSELTDFEKAMAQPNIDKNKMEIHRIQECRLIFDPLQLKSTAIWFNQQVKQYEKLFGTIPSPEEVAEKQKRSKDQ